MPRACKDIIMVDRTTPPHKSGMEISSQALDLTSQNSIIVIIGLKNATVRFERTVVSQWSFVETSSRVSKCGYYPILVLRNTVVRTLSKTSRCISVRVHRPLRVVVELLDPRDRRLCRDFNTDIDHNRTSCSPYSLVHCMIAILVSAVLPRKLPYMADLCSTLHVLWSTSTSSRISTHSRYPNQL